jgi:hypothetical protein
MKTIVDSHELELYSPTSLRRTVMSRHVIIGGLLLVAGILIGMNLPTLYAQQGEGRRGAPPTLTNEQLSQEVAALRQLIPTNSTIMMDVQWHWTNLWWAGRKRNWPLAQYYFNEARGHIQQLVRKNPTIRNTADGTDVDLTGIFDGIDTSSLAMVKDAIAKKDAPAFEKNYKTMLESCYSCHKSVGRPYIRPQVPTALVQAIVNMDVDAAWPQ